jgi:hypothetical protein
MDPTANLEEQLDIVEDILLDRSRDADPTRLAELVIALHNWISNGGFLPKQWEHNC